MEHKVVMDKWKTDLNTLEFSNIFITKIGHMFDEPNHFFTNWFVRHDYCIQFVVGGEGEYFVNNTLYHLKKNTLFLLPKDRYHYYTSNTKNPYDYYWVHFNGTGFEHFLDAIGLSEENPVIFDVDNPKIKDCFEILIDACKNSERYDNLDILAKSYSLVHQFAITIPNTAEENKKKVAFSATVELVANYITEHYKEKITLDNLAEISHVNKCYLVSLFKTNTGLTPIQYLIQYRISQACAMLHTDMRITDICYACGFQELTNFLIRFKQFTKRTPSEYRKSIQT